jgi:hypothetical protein
MRTSAYNKAMHPTVALTLCLILFGPALDYAQSQKYKTLAVVEVQGALTQWRSDDRFVYWVVGDEMRRVPKEGGPVNIVGPADQFCAQYHGSTALMSEDGYIYWAGGGSIERCLASGGRAENLASVSEYIRWFGLTPTKVAWGTDGIGRPNGGLVQVMPRTGGPIVTIASNLQTSTSGGLVTDGETLYWIETRTQTLMRASTDGRGFAILCKKCADDGLFQDKTHVYSILPAVPLPSHSLVQIPKVDASKGATRSYRELYRGPISFLSISTNSVAIDDKFVYLPTRTSDQNSGQIVAINKATLHTSVVVDQLTNPIRIFVDNAALYFIDSRADNLTVIGSITKP